MQFIRTANKTNFSTLNSNSKSNLISNINCRFSRLNSAFKNKETKGTEKIMKENSINDNNCKTNDNPESLKETENSKMSEINSIYTFAKNTMDPPQINNFIQLEKFKHLKNVCFNSKKDIENINARKNVKDADKKDKKNIEKCEDKTDEKAIPFSPKLGPFEVKTSNRIENKNYHWCSCGLSQKQPFCDRSHKGSAFKPINFQLAEKVANKEILLCGCKLSREAPFCDRFTCVKLASLEEKDINSKISLFNQSKNNKENGDIKAGIKSEKKNDDINKNK